MSEPDFELVAASLRADTADLKAFVEALAAKLEGALPDRTTVERRGGFLGGPKRVRTIAVRLGEGEYLLDAGDGPPACRRRALVRGIALRTEELSLDGWIDALSRELVGAAGDGARDRAALGRLLDA